ncbi:MAG: MATE family efflux transporter [Bifidobacteriaceae bacterium]|jgi:putative MATE family efflux protein|nr:MATE family efflux transporter [Bifidobacteriaceae bacterium]
MPKLSSRKEYAHLIKISLSVLSQTVILPLAITVDTAIVGRLLGTVELAGLSVGAVIMNTILGIGVFIIFSTNAAVAQHIGAGQNKKAVDTIINTIVLGVLLGAALTVLGYTLLRPATYAFDVMPEVREAAQFYMMGYMVCFPAIVVDMGCSGILRGLRKYKPLTIASFSSFALNIPMVLIFVQVFHMGLFGTGLAAAITIWLETIVKLIIVWRHVRQFNYKLRPSLDGVLTSFNEGVPILVREIVMWTTNLFLVYSIGVIGTAAVAGAQVSETLWVYVIFVLDSISQAITTLVGERIGEKDWIGAKETLRRAIKLSLGYAGVLSLVLLGGGWFVPYIFTSDSEVIVFAIAALIEGGLVVFHMAYTFVVDGALIASKDTKYLAFVSVVASIVYIGSAFVAINLVPHDFWGFIIVYGCYDGVFIGIRALLAKFRHNSDRWLRLARKEVGTSFE